MVLPLCAGTYVEVVECLDHPASDKAPFGQAVRARSELGGGWLGWVIAVPDIAPLEGRLGREAVQGNRYRPDGHELRWKQIGVKGLQSDPQLPFFVQWESYAADHPSIGARTGCTWSASRSPATPTASASGSAVRSRVRSRTSRSTGSGATAPPAWSRRSSAPPTAPSASERRRR